MQSTRIYLYKQREDFALTRSPSLCFHVSLHNFLSPWSRTEMKFPRMHAINLILLAGAASMLLLCSDAIEEEGTISYSKEVRIPGRCISPPCCRIPFPCRNIYRFKGDWKSKRDSTSITDCIRWCTAHRKMCLSVCDKLTNDEDVQDGERCKCVTRSIRSVRTTCQTACDTAFLGCQLFCKRFRTCARARTRVDMTITAGGRCSRILCQGPQCLAGR